MASFSAGLYSLSQTAHWWNPRNPARQDPSPSHTCPRCRILYLYDVLILGLASEDVKPCHGRGAFAICPMPVDDEKGSGIYLPMAIICIGIKDKGSFTLCMSNEALLGVYPGL